MEMAAKEPGEVEVYRQIAGLVHTVVNRCFEGISQEESLIQPGANGNCMNWVLGHLTRVYDDVMPLVGQKSSGEFERYERGGAPLKNGDGAADIGKLRQAWEENAKRFEEGLATLTAKQLEAPAPFSPMNNPKETVGSLLSMMLFHQAYHAGQLGLLRRVAGKNGVLG